MMTHHWFIQSRIQSTSHIYRKSAIRGQSVRKLESCSSSNGFLSSMHFFKLPAGTWKQFSCGNLEVSIKPLVSPKTPKPNLRAFGLTTTNLTRRSPEECCFCFGKFAHQNHIKFAFLWSHDIHGIVTKPFCSSFNTPDSVLRLPRSLHYLN